jgi:lysophospholipase
MTEAEILNHRNAAIRTYSWKPSKTNGAAIIFVHGYAEYGGRYKQTASFFAEQGYSVFSFDHHGHGNSYGKPGLVTSWNQLVEDASLAIEHFISINPEIHSWFILGHSMGGGIATFLAKKYGDTLQGALFSAPMIDQATQAPALVIATGKLIAKFLPSLGIIPFDQSAQSRDPDVLKAFYQDHLNYKGRLRAGTGFQLLEMIKEIDTLPSQISVPVWIGHSSIDRLTSFEASKRFFNRLASTDKTFKKYDGLFHEIMNEPEKRIVLQDMLIWMQKRVKG